MLTLDANDRALLRQLQARPDLGLPDLAHAAGLTPTTAARRLARLEKAGVIEGYERRIDFRALGYEVGVSLRVTLDKTQPNAFDAFINEARKIPEVNEIQTFLGRVDVRLNVLAHDMQHYQEIYRNRILTLPHISDIEALMQIGTVKNSESLPL